MVCSYPCIVGRPRSGASRAMMDDEVTVNRKSNAVDVFITAAYLDGQAS